MKNKISFILKTYFSRKKDVLAVFVFGSTVTGRTRPWSDLDLALLMKPKVTTSPFDIEVDVRLELEKHLGEKVDVVILNNADPFLREQIYTKGEMIYTRNKKATEDLKWRHIKKDWDYMPIKRIMDQTALDRLKQAR